MNSIQQIGHVTASKLIQIQQIQKAKAFFEAWKAAIKSIDPVFFLYDDKLSINDTVYTRDLKPNVDVIKSQIGSLKRQEQHFICVLVSFYDVDVAKEISQYVDFKFFRDFVNFDDNQKELIAQLIKNFSSSQDYWGDFIN